MKFFHLTLFCASLCLLACPIARAESVDTTAHRSVADRVVGLAEFVLRHLTTEHQSWSAALYPAAGYSERTGLEVGLMGMLQVYGKNQSARPATITPSFLVSTKRMFEVQCDADFYMRNTDVVLKAEIYRLPDNFYAIGNGKNKQSLAEYTFERRMLTADVLHHIDMTNIRVGVALDADYYKFYGISLSDSTPTTNFFKENAGGNYGAGLLVAYDSRDNVVAPRRGSFLRLRLMGYADIWGVNRRSGAICIDGRHYWSLPLRSVLAAQLYAMHTWGDVSFAKMPSCGGTRLGRAIGHSLKYVDQTAWLCQSEWRVPLFWRIGGTLFAGLGNVAHSASTLLDNVHLMAGGGLRFAVFADKGLNLRLDAGVSSRGDRAIYFNIREAF